MMSPDPNLENHFQGLPPPPTSLEELNLSDAADSELISPREWIAQFEELKLESGMTREQSLRDIEFCERLGIKKYERISAPIFKFTDTIFTAVIKSNKLYRVSLEDIESAITPMELLKLDEEARIAEIGGQLGVLYGFGLMSSLGGDPLLGVLFIGANGYEAMLQRYARASIFLALDRLQERESYGKDLNNQDI